MKSKKGFTLIELLVVVLIIGILAAIAVPKYQVAVEKSKIAQVLSAVKTISQAQEAYYLANGRYTDNINDLDISVSAPDGWEMSLTNNENYSKVSFARLPNDTYKISIISHYKFSPNGIYLGQIYCSTKKDNSFWRKICSSISSNEGSTASGYFRAII